MMGCMAAWLGISAHRGLINQATMRLRSNSCLLLLSAAPLVSSLTSKDWGSSTTASSSGRSSPTGRPLPRHPVPRRDADSCFPAAINSIDGSAFGPSGRRDQYGENGRGSGSSPSLHASHRLGYFNLSKKTRLARRRRPTSTRTPTSLCANSGTAGTFGVDTKARAEKTTDIYAKDEGKPKKIDKNNSHRKQSDDEAATNDASKNKMKFRTFEEMLEKYRDTPILVSFEAKWCGPCKLMKKELKIVRDELADSVMVARIDTEKFPSLGARYEVEGLPSVILFVDGEPVHRIEGLEEASEILRQVRGFLA